MILGSVAELTNALDEKEKKLAVLDQSIARREAQVAEQIRSTRFIRPRASSAIRDAKPIWIPKRRSDCDRSGALCWRAGLQISSAGKHRSAALRNAL
jgi:hypothetical protein